MRGSRAATAVVPPFVRGRSSLLPLAAVVLGCLLWPPSIAFAQPALRPQPRFEIEPRVGAWWARLEDSEDVDYSARAGTFTALRVTQTMTPRLRGVASIGYARLEDASVERVTRLNGDVLTSTTRLEIVPVTAGIEWDVNAGRTVLSLGLEGGAAWGRSPVTRRTGPAPDFDDPETSRGWEAGFVLLPGVSIRRETASGVGLSLSVQSFWDEGTFSDGNFFLAPVASVGVRWAIR